MAESQLENWQAWYEACALGRCSSAVSADLQSFARSRMVVFLQRYATRTNLQRSGQPEVSAAEAWHLLETHLTASATRSGKRYKDWLFSRTESEPGRALPIIEAGASVIMRTVTRSWLRHEFSPRGTVSLQTIIAADSGRTLTLQDLLPDPGGDGDDATGREYEELASHHASQRFAAIDERERLVLLARALGLPLSHTAVTNTAGCGKSALSECYRLLVADIGRDVQRRYPDEGDGAMPLAMMILQKLKQRTFIWGKSETAYADLFMVAGQQ